MLAHRFIFITSCIPHAGYWIVVGLFNLLNFPVAWFILYCGGSPELAQFSIIFFAIGALFLRVSMLRLMTQFPVREFFLSTVMRCLVIMLICISISYIIASFCEIGLLSFLFNLGVTELSLCSLVYFVGVNVGEREFIKRKITVILRRR